MGVQTTLRKLFHRPKGGGERRVQPSLTSTAGSEASGPTATASSAYSAQQPWASSPATAGELQRSSNGHDQYANQQQLQHHHNSSSGSRRTVESPHWQHPQHTTVANNANGIERPRRFASVGANGSLSSTAPVTSTGGVYTNGTTESTEGLLKTHLTDQHHYQQQQQQQQQQHDAPALRRTRTEAVSQSAFDRYDNSGRRVQSSAQTGNTSGVRRQQQQQQQHQQQQLKMQLAIERKKKTIGLLNGDFVSPPGEDAALARKLMLEASQAGKSKKSRRRKFGKSNTSTSTSGGGGGGGGSNSSSNGNGPFTADDEHRRLMPMLTAIPEIRAALDAEENQLPVKAWEIVYENQRGIYLTSLPWFSAKLLWKFDPPPWSSDSKSRILTDVGDYQTSDVMWVWDQPYWMIDMSGDVDEDGWQYASRFNSSNWNGGHKRRFKSLVRRRRWIRLKRRIDYADLYAEGEIDESALATFPTTNTTDHYQQQQQQQQQQHRHPVSSMNSYDSLQSRRQRRPSFTRGKSSDAVSILTTNSVISVHQLQQLQQQSQQQQQLRHKSSRPAYSSPLSNVQLPPTSTSAPLNINTTLPLPQSDSPLPNLSLSIHQPTPRKFVRAFSESSAFSHPAHRDPSSSSYEFEQQRYTPESTVTTSASFFGNNGSRTRIMPVSSRDVLRELYRLPSDRDRLALITQRLADNNSERDYYLHTLRRNISKIHNMLDHYEMRRKLDSLITSASTASTDNLTENIPRQRSLRNLGIERRPS